MAIGVSAEGVPATRYANFSILSLVLAAVAGVLVARYANGGPAGVPAAGVPAAGVPAAGVLATGVLAEGVPATSYANFSILSLVLATGFPVAGVPAARYTTSQY